MTVVATKSAFSAAKSLLEHYGFDLGEQTSGQLLDRWGDQCDPRWIRLALIEALHQGRYKAVSVEQILSLWSRRGQPSYHFDRDFEALICNNQPQDLSSVSSRSDALESPDPGSTGFKSKSKPDTAMETMALSRASAGAPVQMLSQPKTEPNQSVQPPNPSSQTQSSAITDIQPPEIKLPLPSSLNHRTIVPLGSSLLMDSDQMDVDQDENCDTTPEQPSERFGNRSAAKESLGTSQPGIGVDELDPSASALYSIYSMDTDTVPIDLDTDGWDTFVAGWEEAIIPNPSASGASISSQSEVLNLDTLLTELMDTPAVDALDSVNPPAAPSLVNGYATEQAQDLQNQDLQNLEVHQNPAANAQIAIQDLDQGFGVEIGNLPLDPPSEQDQSDQDVHLDQISDHIEAITSEPNDSTNGIGVLEHFQDHQHQPTDHTTHNDMPTDAGMGLGSGSNAFSPKGGAITKFEPELQVSDVFNKLREVARIWKLQTSAIPSSTHGQFPVIEPDIIRDFP
jgi:hypothetical protein